MLRLDQALGRAPEALTPRRPPPPVFALRRFLEPLFNVDAILEATQASLRRRRRKTRAPRRGRAARGAASLRRRSAATASSTIGVSRPERDGEAAAAALPREAQSRRRKISTPSSASKRRGSMSCSSSASKRGAHAGRRGRSAASAREDRRDRRRPERAARRPSACCVRSSTTRMRRSAPAGWRVRSAPSLAERVGRERSALTQKRSARQTSCAARSRCSRARNRSKCIATVPDGPPIRFRWRRVLREVVRAEGPERIAGDWLGASRRATITASKTRKAAATGSTAKASTARARSAALVRARAVRMSGLPNSASPRTSRSSAPARIRKRWWSKPLRWGSPASASPTATRSPASCARM